VTRPDHPQHPSARRTRSRGMLTVGVGALALLAVVASACSSGNSTAVTTTTATGGSSSASTTGGSSSTGASGAATIDPCSVVTDAVAAKVYGAGSTVTTSPSSDKRTCQVSIQGLSYELSIHVDPASDYKMQKSILFVNPTNFPGLGKEAVIGKSSDNTGAVLGLLYRTDGGTVYLSDESDQAKLTALAGAIAAQG
jgi:hypothetical protein